MKLLIIISLFVFLYLIFFRLLSSIRNDTKILTYIKSLCESITYLNGRILELQKRIIELESTQTNQEKN